MSVKRKPIRFQDMHDEDVETREMLNRRHGIATRTGQVPVSFTCPFCGVGRAHVAVEPVRWRQALPRLQGDLRIDRAGLAVEGVDRVMTAWPYMPGAPAAGHITSGGFWHPGNIDGCPKCELTSVTHSGHTVNVPDSHRRYPMGTMTTYKITRFYQDPDKASEVVARGLTEEQALAHCNDPETSSSTATTSEAQARTKAHGEWFDGFDEEK